MKKLILSIAILTAVSCQKEAAAPAPTQCTFKYPYYGTAIDGTRCVNFTTSPNGLCNKHGGN